jgi:hypothetical protein
MEVQDISHTAEAVRPPKQEAPKSAAQRAQEARVREDRINLQLLQEEDPSAHAKELERRRDNAKKVAEAQAVLGLLKDSRPLETRSDLASAMRKEDAIAMMSTMAPERHALGEGQLGVSNATERWRFGAEASAANTAFAKPSLGETAFRYFADPDAPEDAKRGHVFRVIRTVEGGKLKESFVNAPPDVENALKHIQKDAARYAAMMRDGYGEEAKLPDITKETTMKLGFLPGRGAYREVGAYVGSELLGFDQVPPTTLRLAENGMDVFSVQQHVEVTNPEKMPREFDKVDMDLLDGVGDLVTDQELAQMEAFVAGKQAILQQLVQGPDRAAAVQARMELDEASERLYAQKLARSMTEAATMQYILGAYDGHAANTYVNPDTGKVSIIDNGYTLGLSTRQEVPQEDGSTKPEMRPLNPIESIPLEVLEQHASWKVPETTQKRLKGLMDETLRYFSFRQDEAGWKQAHPGEAPPEGKFIRGMVKMLRMVHGDNHIADAEGTEILRRLKEVIDNAGRPPSLKERALLHERWSREGDSGPVSQEASKKELENALGEASDEDIENVLGALG